MSLHQTRRLIKGVAHEGVLSLSLQDVLDFVTQIFFRQVDVTVRIELEAFCTFLSLKTLD